MNMTTGEILFSKNPDEPIAPASLTKILSLYLIYEALGEGRVRTSDIVHVSSSVSQVNGSRMRIRPGSQIALGDLMKGMAIMSANDASVAAAEYIGGDVDEFVRRMNVKALELGMTGSHFSNPSGLREEGQVTTARDILTLSCAYINRFPQSLEMHSLPVFEYGRRIRNNTNHLLETNHYVDGLKTGHVAGSGYHLVVTARKNNTRIVAVVLGSRSSAARFREARSLLEQGFKAVQAPASAKRMAGVPTSLKAGSGVGLGPEIKEDSGIHEEINDGDLSPWSCAAGLFCFADGRGPDNGRLVLRRTGSRPIASRGHERAAGTAGRAATQRNAWLQGDEQQQEQLAGCYRLSALLAYHSREIRKMLVVSEVNWKEVTAQYEDLKRGIALLMEKHEQFALELNNGQRSWWERQLQEIMALQLQLNEQAGVDRSRT